MAQAFAAEGRITLDITGVAGKLRQLEGQVSGFTARGQGSLRGLTGGRGFGGLQGAIAGVATKIPGVGIAVGAAVGGIGAAFAGTVGKFTSFERDISRTFALIPDASEDVREKLTDDVQTIISEFGIAEEDAVQSLYDAISVGVPPENILTYLTENARLAVSGAVPLTSAINLSNTAMQVWGLTATDAASAGDLFTRAVALGRTDLQGLDDAIAKAGPTAAAFGVDIDTLTALIADNTLVMGNARESGTQMNAMLSELGKSGTKAFKGFEEANGKTFPEFVEEGGDVTEGLLQMRQHAEENGLSMADMFSSIEAGKGALIATRDDAQSLINIQGELDQSAGATGAAYEVMEGTIGQSMSRIKGTFSVVLSDIGESLAPFVAGVASFIADKLPGAVETITGWLGNVVNVFKGFWNSIFGDATNFWEVLANYFMTVGTIFKDIWLNIGRLQLWAVRKGLGLIVKWIGIGVDKIVEIFVSGLKLIPGLILDMAQRVVRAGSRMFGWIPGVGAGLKALENGLDSFKDSFDNFGKDVNLVQALGDFINPDGGPELDFSDTIRRLNLARDPTGGIDVDRFNDQGMSEQERALAGVGATAQTGSRNFGDNPFSGPLSAETFGGTSGVTTTGPSTGPASSGARGGSTTVNKTIGGLEEIVETLDLGFTKVQTAVWGIQDQKLVEQIGMLEEITMTGFDRVTQLGGAQLDALHKLVDITHEGFRVRETAAATAADAAGGATATGGELSRSMTIVVDDRNTAGRVAEEVAWLQTKETIGVSA